MLPERFLWVARNTGDSLDFYTLHNEKPKLSEPLDRDDFGEFQCWTSNDDLGEYASGEWDKFGTGIKLKPGEGPVRLRLIAVIQPLQTSVPKSWITDRQPYKAGTYEVTMSAINEIPYQSFEKHNGTQWLVPAEVTIHAWRELNQ
jgi:hypothetical protein